MEIENVKAIISDLIDESISQAMEKARQEERERIVSIIEGMKLSGYEGMTIVEGILAELKVGSSIRK